jgi:hypothetical protein
MGKDSTRVRQERRVTGVKWQVEGQIQFLRKAEEQILRSISARVETAVILDEICRALDFQIGGVVSYVSRPGDDPSELAAIVMKARLHGLSSFCSESVAGKNKRQLGTLEMYCCDSRRPSAGEHRLIERAKCLAALAIQRDKETCRRRNSRVWENQLVRSHFRAGLEQVN